MAFTQYPGQDEDRIEIPGVPDDIKWLGDNIANLTHWAKKTYDAMRRQESPNPTVLNFNRGEIVRTSTRYRCKHLVFSIVAAGVDDVMQLRIGTAPAWDWIAGVDKDFPMPLIIDAGVDVEVVDSTNADREFRCRIIAYTELQEGGE